MSIQLGPILHAAVSDRDTWRFTLLLALADIDDPATQITIEAELDAAAAPADPAPAVGAPHRVADFRDAVGWTVWTWPVEAPRAATEQTLTYRIQGVDDEPLVVDRVAVPALGHLPRLALVSCNGFSDSKRGRDVDEPYEMWRRMDTRHRRGLAGGHPDDPSGFHLLVGSGDQIYADQIDVLQELDKKSISEAQSLRSVSAWERKALPQYLRLYREIWSEEPVSAMLARIPALFTWDDHDILDGWGSHRDGIQTSLGYLGAYAAARKAFLALQLAADPTEVTPPRHVVRARTETEAASSHLLQALSFRTDDRWLDLVALDLRSERSRDKVLSPAQWRELKAWLERYVDDCAQADQSVDLPSPDDTAEDDSVQEVARHLVIVSSIPVVYLRFRGATHPLGSLVLGQLGFEDDILDHWEHSRHQGERERLLMTLFDVQARSRARVTMLSGDVHLAGRGRVTSTRREHQRRAVNQEARIEQIISSGIVHPPPTVLERSAISLAGDPGPHELIAGIESRLLDFDAEYQLLPQRNFAALSVDGPDGPGRLWVEWVTEDGATRRQTVIDP
ncbi:MAG: alkaline phosphatase D family protein [Acidobacteriota bacterium]